MLEKLKLEQIAIATNSAEQTKEFYGKLGLTNWITDQVVATGTVFGKKGTNKAELNFNYDMGFEFEILEYKEGSSWHDKRVEDGDKFPFVSHLGTHIESEEKLQEIKKVMIEQGYEIAQEVWTDSHTNEYLLEKKRKFHYIIFDSKERLGFDLKLIVRRENCDC